MTTVGAFMHANLSRMSSAVARCREPARKDVSDKERIFPSSGIDRVSRMLIVSAAMIKTHPRLGGGHCQVRAVDI